MNFKKIIILSSLVLLNGCNNKSSISNSESISKSTSNSTLISTHPSISNNSTSLVNTKSITFNFLDLKDKLPTASSKEEIKITNGQIELGVVSANYGTYNGGGYLMLRKTKDTNGAGHIYNTSSVGNISSVTIKCSSSTSKNAIIGITFGNEVINEAVTDSTLKERTDTNKVITFSNDSKDNTYFNLSVMNNYNCQLVELTINFD